MEGSFSEKRSSLPLVPRRGQFASERKTPVSFDNTKERRAYIAKEEANFVSLERELEALRRNQEARRQKKQEYVREQISARRARQAEREQKRLEDWYDLFDDTRSAELWNEQDKLQRPDTELEHQLDELQNKLEARHARVRDSRELSTDLPTYAKRIADNKQAKRRLLDLQTRTSREHVIQERAFGAQIAQRNGADVAWDELGLDTDQTKGSHPAQKSRHKDYDRRRIADGIGEIQPSKPRSGSEDRRQRVWDHLDVTEDFGDEPLVEEAEARDWGITGRPAQTSDTESWKKWIQQEHAREQRLIAQDDEAAEDEAWMNDLARIRSEGMDEYRFEESPYAQSSLRAMEEREREKQIPPADYYRSLLGKGYGYDEVDKHIGRIEPDVRHNHESRWKREEGDALTEKELRLFVERSRMGDYSFPSSSRTGARQRALRRELMQTGEDLVRSRKKYDADGHAVRFSVEAKDAAMRREGQRSHHFKPVKPRGDGGTIRGVGSDPI